jgi:hypothetical protein
MSVIKVHYTHVCKYHNEIPYFGQLIGANQNRVYFLKEKENVGLSFREA